MRKIVFSGVLGVLLLGLGAPTFAADETQVRWRLGRSDLLRYTRTYVDKKGTRTNAGIISVFGHAIRDQRTFAPATPRHLDIPALLGFHLPDTAKAEKRKFEWVFPKTVPVRVRGTCEIKSKDEKTATVVGTYKFESRGKGERTDTEAIYKGKATVEMTFDLVEHRPIVSQVQIDYLVGAKKLKRGDVAKPIERTVELKLRKAYPRRYEKFDETVEKAIHEGVAYLRTIQIAAGEEFGDSFKPHGKERLGSTALAVLTLAACDVPLEDPAMQRALSWMVTQKPTRTYERAISLMAFDKAYTPPEERVVTRMKRGKPVRKLTAPHRKWCIETFETLMKSAQSPGTWGYPATGRTSFRYDTSNTQYAVLAMRSAANLGFEIKDSSWLAVIRFFKLIRAKHEGKGTVHLIREGQATKDDGKYAQSGIPKVLVDEIAGFKYGSLSSYLNPWGSMTCAGIASLAIARHALEESGSAKWNPKLSEEVEQLIRGGWAWLDRNWAVDRHPENPENRWLYYYLYSLERAAVLDRVKRVAGRDWYYEGAVELLVRRNRNGSWGRGGGSRVAPTCFALLFLKRATAPLTAG